MYYPRKLKQDISLRGLIPAIICLSVGAIIWALVGAVAALSAVAAFFVLYAGFSFWIFARTQNLSYLSASVWQLLFGIFMVTRPKYHLIIPAPEISALITVLLLAATVWLFWFVFTKRAKWKGREVFELASLPVETQSDGFTGRPRPVGKLTYTHSELRGFASFLQRNLIAMPCYEENRIILVPVKMDDEFNYLFNPERFRKDRSWIAFDFQGNITVNISHRDYLDYKEELSFDQLCDNLGKLFIRFMEYYRKGEADRIVYQLNELDLGFTS
jgi:hypothetical protein